MLRGRPARGVRTGRTVIDGRTRETPHNLRLHLRGGVGDPGLDITLGPWHYARR